MTALESGRHHRTCANSAPMGTMLHKQSAHSLTIRCHKPHDAFPVCRRELSLRPGLSNQFLCVSKLHAERPEDGKQHHGAAMNTFFTMNVDSGFGQSASGEREVHRPLKQFGLLGLKVVPERAPQNADPRSFRYRRVIEGRLQIPTWMMPALASWRMLARFQMAPPRANCSVTQL